MSNFASDSPTRRSVLQFGAVVLVVIAVAVVAWLLLKEDDSADEGQAASASVADLQEEAASSDQPIFWAGERAGFSYELTKTPQGTFVRYLPQGVDAGDPRPNFLTVATYDLPNGYARVQAASRRPGARRRNIANGGVVLVNSRRPSSVYVAYPRGRYQIEVYDPSPGRALDLAASGEIQQVR